MSNSDQISELIDHITEDVRTIVAGEIALVKAEIKPVVRRFGFGAGLVGAAGYFVISATIILWFTIAAGFTWLFAGTTKLSPWACVFFGTLTAVVFLLAVAALIAIIGGRSMKNIRGPELAGSSIAQSLGAVRTGFEEGSKRVETELNQASPLVRAPVGGSALEV